MIIPKNFPAPETHYMCEVCSEAITNPLCPFCLTEEVKAWLTLYPNLSSELLPKLNKYLEMISNQIVNYGTECIKCKNKRASVCPYCFTEFVFRELKKINTGPFILKEFFEFFNFDFHHTGYTKEFEQMGVLE
jgi:hypothetical protein